MSEVKAMCFGLAESLIGGLVGKIGKKGRMEIRTETFGNYFVLETLADEIDLTTHRLEPIVFVKTWSLN